ncbi:MAG: PrgI family protein [Patescibacteria group bacterium]|nr:PrgI family protein [Patescibacteria group bacterium]
MEQHPIPRQITTFEFKLIGFLTIKQFIYLLVFAGFAFVVYLLTPIPFLNYLFAFLVAGTGLTVVFVPINDRPMDIWIKNLIKRLTSPTQYNFKKENKPPAVLLDIVKNYSPSVALNYIDSQQKLNNYLSSKTQKNTEVDKRKQQINDILINSPVFTHQQQKTNNQQPINQTSTTINQKKPFISGIVTNYKKTPLAGILIYIKKEENGEPIRILKTNSHGVFLSFNPFPAGEYIFEIKDPKQTYFFDTMKLRVENENNNPFEIQSRELI